ncbi:MAG: hypothetical protein AVDCRST_MAG19-1388 [uncultured Thermomicrobiales bacterium]|uniref:Uncharacterized protein n=1 Tax=uncultured Thermomicrobiales bacterium TaxID=1645740 RepID=A0A6J4UTU2_9BACT|nr:MAG: hypothetical protein AVDCRST_MAG19-1388 [uncultured Thermomicrobiales bacterium]
MSFPDDGLREGDTLCIALFAGPVENLAAPDRRVCLGPGRNGVRFDGLTHGPHTVILPAPGSTIDGDRYQATVAETDIPADLAEDAFAVDIALAFARETVGTSGRVEINIFGCPPGTDGGGDPNAWQSQCDTLIGGAPVSLSGIGSIEDTAPTEMTSLDEEAFGQAEFVNLPAGEYALEERLPEDVAEDTAVFVSSSVDGGTTATELEPEQDTLALGPSETKSVSYYVVLKPEEEPAPLAPAVDATSANPDIAGPAADPAPAPDPAAQPRLEITGGPDAPPAATPVVDGHEPAA